MGIIEFLVHPQTVAAIVLCITLISVLHAKFKLSGLPLPPGPPGHWLFGNTLPRALYESCLPSSDFILNSSIQCISQIRGMDARVWACILSKTGVWYTLQEYYDHSRPRTGSYRYHGERRSIACGQTDINIRGRDSVRRNASSVDACGRTLQEVTSVSREFSLMHCNN